jgi:hypothetical protein
MRPQRLIIVGAHGQAREAEALVAAINRREERFLVLGFVVTDLAKLGAFDSRDRVLGDYRWIEAHGDEVDALALGIGWPAARLRVAGDLMREFPRLSWPALVHPSAELDQDTLTLGKGVMVGAGVVGTVNLHLEDFALANFACTLGHEAHLAPGAVVNPGANISGGVSVGGGRSSDPARWCGNMCPSARGPRWARAQWSSATCRPESR